MKYIFLLLTFFLVSFSGVFAALKDDMIPNSGRAVLTSQNEAEGLLDYVLDYGRDVIFALMAVIAIGMFLFIGARLVMAQGNPEEFSKALKSLIYAAVGIFLVAFAWALVKLIAGIQI